MRLGLSEPVLRLAGVVAKVGGAQAADVEGEAAAALQVEQLTVRLVQLLVAPEPGYLQGWLGNVGMRRTIIGYRDNRLRYSDTLSDSQVRQCNQHGVGLDVCFTCASGSACTTQMISTSMWPSRRNQFCSISISGGSETADLLREFGNLDQCFKATISML